MNIFQNRDRFFGKPNFISIRGNMDEFWRFGSEIKLELGDKEYYLDKYLNVIFETLADLDLATASSVADDICWGILADCYIVCGDDEDLIKKKEKSIFFEIVKNYIDSHPVDFREEHTKLEFYAGKIILENLERIHKEFKRQYKNKVLMKIDYPLANSYFQKISSIVGEEKIEDFNNVMSEAFVFEGAGLLASQHSVVRAVGMLLYRDPESSKQIYQLMMGEK